MIEMSLLENLLETGVAGHRKQYRKFMKDFSIVEKYLRYYTHSVGVCNFKDRGATSA
jgi:hypothetical protein